MDKMNNNLNRTEGNNRGRVDYTRQRYKEEMKREQEGGIPRNDRADKQLRDFNSCIYKIKYVIEKINEDQIQTEYRAELQEISRRYPTMFTVVIGKYPELFGPPTAENADGRALPELFEQIKKKDNPNKFESLVRKGGTWQRDRDEITIMVPENWTG